MAESEELGRYIFDTYVANAGPYWPEPFRKMAEWELSHPDTCGLGAQTRAWSTAALMVRTGLHLCERRDPGLYHDFLVGLLVGIHDEWGFAEEKGFAGPALEVPWQVYTPESNMMGIAEKIIGQRVIDEPRAVAFTLICEGLKFCEEFAPKFYLGFIMSASKLVSSEAERVQGGPKKLLPRVVKREQRHLRILTPMFNCAAA
ncbi:MAG: hypothetical protein RIM84_18645 [Alphaproteobacteria bacterium]